MWNVLIADDEPIIRRGLVKTVTEAGRDLVVTAVAEDGRQALEMAIAQKPDLLLVDVCMPFLSGLQFLEKLKKETSDSVIIIVSGHDEFEYAREALRLGASDFILKPIDEGALLAAIDSAIGTLKTRRDASRYMDWARAQIGQQKGEYRRRFLCDLIGGRLSSGEIAHSAEFFSVALPNKWGMAMARINERILPGNESEQDRLTRFLSLESLVIERFPEDKGNFAFEDDAFNLIVLGGAEDPSEWIDAAVEITERAGRRLSLEVFAVQGFADGCEALPDCYAELSALLSKSANTPVLAASAMEYMRAGYSRFSLSLEETAEALKISPGYLSRVLRRENNAAFTESLTRMRVDKALALLRDPGITVSEIAASVGFSSIHYFSRTFKRITGMSPMEFRRGGHL